MSSYVVDFPRDDAELEATYDLFARSFGPDYSASKKRMDFLRKAEPYSPLSNHLIVKEPYGDIVGALRLVDRELMFGEVRLRAAGMSLFAVHPDHWYMGVAQAIQRQFFELANHNFDLTFGFARKRMDGYWSRFGYIGYTSFTTLSVDKKSLPGSTGEFQQVDFSGQHLSACQRHYLDNYRDVFCSVYRDAALWDFYVQRIGQDHLGSLICFTTPEGRTVGYALIDQDNILEISGDRDSYPGILAALNTNLGRDAQTLNFDLSPAHPFFRFLLRYPHTYTVRRVWNGGHIAKTAPVSRFLTKIRPVLEARLREAECSSFSIRMNDQTFDWSGTKLETYACQSSGPSDVEFNIGEWQKTLLGVVPPSDVEGFRSSSKRAERVAQILFPVLWPQSPVLDQF